MCLCLFLILLAAEKEIVEKRKGSVGSRTSRILALGNGERKVIKLYEVDIKFVNQR